MITEIGIAAGDIWHHLDKHGSTKFDSLVRSVGKPRELMLMSLGWLAREGHVNVGDSSNGFLVSLTQSKTV